MEARMPTLCLTIALLSVPPWGSALFAQTGPPNDPMHACNLVTKADVERVTGRASPGAPRHLWDVQQTHSQCSYRKAAVWVALVSKVSAAQKSLDQELVVGGFDRAKRAVAGVGDSAAIYFKPKGRDPEGFLVAYAGTRTLMVQVGVDDGQPSESAQPYAVELAKTALAKLK
jgi:hypothetical protein